MKSCRAVTDDRRLFHALKGVSILSLDFRINFKIISFLGSSVCLSSFYAFDRLFTCQKLKKLSIQSNFSDFNFSWFACCHLSFFCRLPNLLSHLSGWRSRIRFPFRLPEEEGLGRANVLQYRYCIYGR